MRLFALLSFSLSVVFAQDSERFFDVRKIIKETLDVMRAYPPPSTLVQPLPLVSSSSSGAARQTQTLPQSLPLAQQQIHVQQNYPQQQSAVYYQQQQHNGQLRYPYRRTMPAQQTAYASSNNNNNNIKYYGSELQEQRTAPLASGVDGVSLAPFAALPTVTPPLVIPTPLPVGRLFASPTQKDMEQLFHLPADIIHRLATDAGYVDPPSDSAHRAYLTDDEDTAGYGGYYQMAQQRSYSNPSSSSGSSGSGFNFNIQSGSDPAYLLQQPISSATTASQPIVEPSKRNNTIVAAGNPKVFTRNIMRDGKIIQIPIVAIPQANGRVAYIPFERLSDLSDALAKLVSTGQLPADDAIYGNSKRVTSPAGESSTLQSAQFTSNIANRNPFVDQSGDAIATNQVPAQTFRKILPVADLVYPGGPSNLPSSDVSNVKEMSQTTTISSLINGHGKNMAEYDGGEKKLADKRDRKLVATASNAFLQEVETDEEAVASTTIVMPSASGSGEEIVLNGKRYRLVATDASTTSDAADVAFLKASPTERVLDGEQPIALGDAMASMMTHQTVSSPQQKQLTVLQQPEAAQPQFGHRIVHQQTEMPSLPYPGELRFPSELHSSTPGFNIFQQQPMLLSQQHQQMNWPPATVAGSESLQYSMTTMPSPQQKSFSASFTVVQQQIDQPIEQATVPPIVVNSGAFSRPVATAPLTNEPKSSFLGASGEIRRKEPNRSLEKHSADSTAIDGRRVLATTSGVGETPLLRQYTLKELEAQYRREYTAAEAMTRAGEDTSSTAAVPTRRIRIGLLSADAGKAQDFRGGLSASTTASPSSSNNATLFAESALRKLTRLERLRQQFAQERAAIARRTKALLAQRASVTTASISTNGTATITPITTTAVFTIPDGQQPTVSEQGITPLTTFHCQNIRRLARQHGTLDVGYFARNNCRLIEQTYAELRCEMADQYLTQCQRYFQSVVSV